MSAIRIATRGSELALWQARFVARRLGETLGFECELVEVRTTGDRLQDVSLAKLGGKGLFVKEIEEALLAGRADVAVHSAKDLPAALHPELRLAAFPERADARDALVCREAGGSLAGLRRGARVGTGSARRRAQLLLERPDLEIAPLRGNVPTRLDKLEDDGLDAVVLACAGLDRLGLSDRIHERIAPERMLPAAAQGIVALEMRADDARLPKVGEAISHPDTALVLAAERGFVEGLGADCSVPAAAYAEILGDGRLRLRALVAAADGERAARAELEVPLAQAAQAGRRVAHEVLAAGGRDILAALGTKAP